MKCFESTVAIDAPAARVWEALTDTDHWYEWTPSITRIERLDEPPIKIGSRFRIVQPRLRTAVWTLSELTPARSFTWTTGNLLLDVTAEHIITTSKDSSCIVTLRVTFSGLLSRVAARLGRPLTEKYLGFEASGLKRRSERMVSAL